MCGRYGRLSRFERISKLLPFGLRNAAGDPPASYNVAPGTEQPVIRAESQGSGSVLVPMRWGLVPYWAKDSKSGVRPVNAKSDTAREKPMFRTLIRSRRCLVPADWFYEWREAADKTPFVIRMASREPFLLGGLWDTWRGGDADPLTTFTILTTAPNELIEQLHRRMPVIVAAEHAARWLDPKVAAIDDLLAPYPAEEMTAYAVSKRVNSARNDEPALIEPIEA